MESFLVQARHLASQYGPVLIKSLAILVLGWLAARLLTAFGRRVLRRANVEPTLRGFLANILYALLLTLVVISALQQLGVPTASFVAIVGAAGLAVGLALQGSLANFASGVLLILFRPFKVGDFIEAGGVKGSVVEVQIFSTILCTPDNCRIIIPNGKITSGTITNYSANDTRRIDLTIGIGYQDDVARAKRIISEILANDARILRSPEPTVAVADLAESSVNLVVRPWVQAGEFWSVRCDLVEAIKKAVEENGISIPFPQRDVHLHQGSAP